MKFTAIAGGALGAIGAVALALSATPLRDQLSAQQVAPDTTVIVRSNGPTLEYQPARLALKHGTRVRIRYINDGVLPHNLVIPKTEGDIEELAIGAADAEGTGYVPVAKKAQMYAYTPLAKPSETVEVTFVMPPPGEYWFVCLYPGHQNTMLGVLRSLR